MRIVLAILVSAAAALSAGCMKSGIIDNAGDVPDINDQPVKTVVLWHTYSEEETKVFEKEIIPEFEKAYPGIHIEPVRQAYNQEYQTALMARASADKTPDLIRMDYTWIPRFARHGLLHPLDRFSDFEEVSAEVHRRMLETNRYGGHMYGLPLNMNTKAAIYNRKLLQKSGLQEPPGTLAEIFETARMNNYAIAMSGLELWSSLPYFFGLGGHFADRQFTATDGYLNSEDSIRALETMVNLHREGILIAESVDRWNEVHSGFRMLMIDEGPWYYSILMNVASPGADVLKKTIPAPFPSSGDYGSIIGGESLVLTKGSKHKEEAWTFIRFMMRKETQNVMLKAGLIPTNLEAVQAAKAGDSGLSSQYIGAYMTGIEEAFYRPALPRWNDIELIYSDMMEDVFLDGRNAREALNEASSLIDRIIGEP